MCECVYTTRVIKQGGISKHEKPFGSKVSPSVSVGGALYYNKLTMKRQRYLRSVTGTTAIRSTTVAWAALDIGSDCHIFG